MASPEQAAVGSRSDATSVSGPSTQVVSTSGERRQSSSTDQLHFGVAALLSNLSEYMTLLPGDVVSTGTPGGVALGMDPPPYLRAGDVVELGIDGLGSSRQAVRA